jgi:chemotaxis protein MotB
MARKKHAEEHENLERWLVSYADFITLLFAYFTTMYAMSTVDAQKMGRLVLSMQAAFDPTGFRSRTSSSIHVGGSAGGAGADTRQASKPIYNSVVSYPLLERQKAAGKGKLKGGTGTGGLAGAAGLKVAGLGKKVGLGGKSEHAGPGGKKKAGGSLDQIKEDVSRLILDEALRDKIQIVVRSRGVIISLAEAGFFKSGGHAARLESRAVLDKIARYLKTLPNLVRIEGHTDNRPIRSARFPSNWELSTSRATHIVAYLIEKHGMDARRLAAAGYGEHHPIDSNDTAEGRARNRRVDIIVLSSTEKTEEPESF